MVAFVQKYMAWIVVLVAAVAFLVPGSFASWVQNDAVLGGFVSVNHLLMLVMFGMGLTLRPADFVEVFRQPRNVCIGCAAQFVAMPLIAFLLCRAFSLPDELAVGVMLVGTCPGGTSSNVMTYMARGDIALSLCMTSVSTLLAPLLTPALTWLYLRTTVEVDALAMFLSIVQVVIVPIALGFVANRYATGLTRRVAAWLPLVSVTAICLIIGYVVDANSGKLLTSGLLITLVVVLHNMLGYGTGFLLARLLGMAPAQRNAIAIEVGMQNSGLATSLALTTFPTLPLATVPGVIFSVWHNFSGALVANWMARRADKHPTTP